VTRKPFWIAAGRGPLPEGCVIDREDSVPVANESPDGIACLKTEIIGNLRQLVLEQNSSSLN